MKIMKVFKITPEFMASVERILNACDSVENILDRTNKNRTMKKKGQKIKKCTGDMHKGT